MTLLDLVQKTTLFESTIKLEGLSFNLKINSQPKPHEIHSNTLYSFYLLETQVKVNSPPHNSQSSKSYFKNKQIISIEKIFFENKNCQKFNLKDPITRFCGDQLTLTDYMFYLQQEFKE